MQGNWETISVDHMVIRYRDSDCDPTVNSSTHVKNGFLHFLCHESNQICECSLGFPSERAVDRDTKWREKTVACDSSHRDCISSISPTETGGVLLARSCGSRNLSPPVWRQWWRQSGSTIGPGWGRQLFLRNAPPLTYLHLWSTVALVD